MMRPLDSGARSSSNGWGSMGSGGSPSAMDAESSGTGSMSWKLVIARAGRCGCQALARIGRREPSRSGYSTIRAAREPFCGTVTDPLMTARRGLGAPAPCERRRTPLRSPTIPQQRIALAPLVVVGKVGDHPVLVGGFVLARFRQPAHRPRVAGFDHTAPQQAIRLVEQW